MKFIKGHHGPCSNQNIVDIMLVLVTLLGQFTIRIEFAITIRIGDMGTFQSVTEMLTPCTKSKEKLTKKLRENACEEADISCNASRYMGWQGHKEGV